MIKTPVFSDGYEIFDKNGHSIISGDEMEANEAVKRINTHDELVAAVNSLLPSLIRESFTESNEKKVMYFYELLERCK